jgi:hypothetical protein
LTRVIPISVVQTEAPIHFPAEANFAFIDRQALARIFAHVLRLLISMLCALGLAFAPVSAGATLLSSDSMPGCTMGKDMPKRSGDHSTMSCCTPACQAPSSAALLPGRDSAAATDGPSVTKFSRAPAQELASIPSSGLDPPPRA